MLHSSWKQLITAFDSDISDKCKIQKYYSELIRKLKAYTMSRFYLKFRLQSRCNRCLERAEKNGCSIRGNEWNIIWNLNVNIVIQLHMCLDIR